MTKEEALQKIQELQEYIENLPVKSNKEELIEQVELIFSSGNYKYNDYIKGDLNINERFISFKFPDSNTEWFFEIIKIAEKICKIRSFNIYPYGNIENNIFKLVWRKKK